MALVAGRRMAGCCARCTVAHSLPQPRPVRLDSGLDVCPWCQHRYYRSLKSPATAVKAHMAGGVLLLWGSDGMVACMTCSATRHSASSASKPAAIAMFNSADHNRLAIVDLHLAPPMLVLVLMNARKQPVEQRLLSRH